MWASKFHRNSNFHFVNCLGWDTSITRWNYATSFLLLYFFHFNPFAFFVSVWFVFLSFSLSLSHSLPHFLSSSHSSSLSLSLSISISISLSLSLTLSLSFSLYLSIYLYLYLSFFVLSLNFTVPSGEGYYHLRYG